MTLQSDHQETRHRITITEAEAKYMVQHDALGVDPVPFGFENTKWLMLLDLMQEGDELWEFRSSLDSWKHHAGIAGIELIRNGEEIESIITSMS